MSQSKNFRNGEDIYGNISCDEFYNLNTIRNINVPNTFPPIGTFSLETVNLAPPTPVQQLSNNHHNHNIFENDDAARIFSSNSILTNGLNNLNLNSGGGGGGGGNIIAQNSINNTSNNSHGPITGSGGQQNHNNANNDASQTTRETGIIEKLLHSYGFIQCCERQARLFFHFSQFSGNIDHLKIGDPVEFEMTYDRRTGKPIASQVTKIAPEVVLSEERVTGTVTTELSCSSNVLSSNETTGRISYENRGECFFLPYTKDDVEGNVNLRAGDKVSFQIATNQRGNLGACHIRLENPAQPVKYRGVVCSMKESFGFIERADVVKEIFFHFSEAEGSIELRPGDDVEFTIQTRNGREYACNITRLPPGSVIFEDVDSTIFKGQVLKPLDRNNPQRPCNDPLPGRIRYRAPDHSEVEVPFGDKDQKGDFTLRHGDWVQFLLATDRRDQLQRATAISLSDETFKVSGEKREQGVVSALKDGFGFLRCVERNVRLFFHFTEVLDPSRELCVGDEVEFTVIQEPGSTYNSSRLCAIRIKHLPHGTVQFETLVVSNIEGVITREAPKSPVKSQDRVEGGVISYDQNDTKKTIMYFLKDCEKPPRIGSRVRFDICLVKRNKELIAVNVVDVTHSTSNLNNHQEQQHHQHHQQQHQHHSQQPQQQLTNGISCSPNSGKHNDYGNMKIEDYNKYDNNNLTNNSGKVYRGFIAVLKENFGFIETLTHDEEVFFHFSNYNGNPSWLELGQEVEYTLAPTGSSTSTSGNCLPAENVKTLPKNSIPIPAVLDAIYNGIVARPLRCINPDQQEYSGLVEMWNDQKICVSTHEFGITSLVNKRDLLQQGDLVTFKIDVTGRAAEITAVRQKKRATVDSIKGQFGFLSYEIEEGKKLFFHMSEVQGNTAALHQGDTVEFSVVTNQRNGKSSACNVIKINDRPDRLISRLKLNSVDDSSPRLIVTRAPRGPQGKGFSPQFRSPRIAGLVAE
ncbi:cold shock domain-containing protein E1 isoform X2 [Condylostylus longicornis]|uniref:cold shock domain-containing protein E1 isoform X2 n=1 Tax=Condylostylus longicornis TaxID=2530218 RepID=UPI00244E370F|nr:cold shock domain-containing protein E1 isoform X2 [Condylostylus longicornis]